MNRKIVTLYGPPINVTNKRSYGGGTGGYTRNMKVYLQAFNSDDFKITPLFHTFRGEYNYGIFTFILRFLIDLKRIVSHFFKHKSIIIHILGQYRSALPREFVLVLIAKIIRKKVVYEIKAGEFIKKYKNSNVFYKWQIAYILKKADQILVEGKVYQSFLLEQFNKESTYFPNVVEQSEIPSFIRNALNTNPIRILFVGYCYEGKGVYELIEGLNKVSMEGVVIELVLIGEEHYKFKEYLNTKELSNNLFLIRRGKLDHKYVLKEMKRCDIYCYPSKHPGEGHNNSINEALMNSMIVIAPKQVGFLSDFLNTKNAYLINDVSAEEIQNAIKLVLNDPVNAINVAKNGKSLILNKFNSNVASKLITYVYNKALTR